MRLMSLFKANYPFDMGFHGVLLRYMQNIRYLILALASTWYILAVKFHVFQQMFNMPGMAIAVLIGIMYLVLAEFILIHISPKQAEQAENFIKFFGLADITMITYAVHITGGSLTSLVLLYLFPLTGFCLIYDCRRCFLITGITILSYYLAVSSSPGLDFSDIINLLAVITPSFFIYTYFLCMVFKFEYSSRQEKALLQESNKKGRLLYKLSKELNQTRSFLTLCDRVFDAIEPVVKIKGMKVFYDIDQLGTCKEIYSYETEQVEWSVNIDNQGGDEVFPEVLKSVNCSCGFFVLPMGSKVSAGMIVIRGNKEELMPEQYDEYLHTVAEIAAASFQNAATMKSLELRSVTDGLTGLLNNNYFFCRLEELVNKARRYRLKFVVAMVDIDHFKSINDTYGHVFGDAVLERVAGVIKQSVRDSDLVARYGGEEFAVIMPHTDLAGARKLMERLRRCLEEEAIEKDGVCCRITVSVGLSSWKPHLEAIDVVKLADLALYTAKNSGRNRVVCEGLYVG